MQHQPVPSVTAADVERIVARDFPPDQRAEVHDLLASLGANAKPRLQLAILKLAHGDLARVASHLKMAQRDWRDVLMWAEYPADAKLSWSMPPEAHHPAYKADWEQYQEWLHRETR